MFSSTPLPNLKLYCLVLAAGLPMALVLIFLSVLSSSVSANSVIYVDADASGGATGLNWIDAFTNLQDALAVAVSGDQVWVAKGVYYPDEGGGQPNDAPTTTFILVNGLALYGGFDGSETQLGQRDPAVNVTVLSGDVDQNDITDPYGVVTDTAHIIGVNTYHVVTGGGTDGSAVLDGFTVTAGQANVSTIPNERGGGMYNDDSSPTITNVIFNGNRASRGGGMYNNGSDPSLTNVTFSGNHAVIYFGGGMYNDDSDPSLTNVTFSGNRAESSGGGMYNTVGSDPSLSDVNFSSNHAFRGGGMTNVNLSSPTLTGVTFSANSADDGGGGMYNNNSSPTLTSVVFSSNDALGGGGGGMANGLSSPTLIGVTFTNNDALISGGGIANSNSNPSLTNVIFSGNSANAGGAMSNANGSNPSLTNVIFSGNSADFFGGGGMANSSSNPSLTNVTFSGNSAPANGGGMANTNSSPTLINVIMWGDTASSEPYEIDNNASSPGIAYSDVQGCGGSGSWDTTCGADNGNNIDADPLLVDPDGADDTPGTLDDDLRLSAGSPAVDSGDNNSCPPSDLDGKPRPIDGDGDDQADCDMGAFEFQIATTTAILSDDPDPSEPSEPFTVTFSVTSTLGTPTGMVTVTVGGTAQTCSGTLTGGFGNCTLELSNPGSYELTASYSGEYAFAPSNAVENHLVQVKSLEVYLPIIMGKD